MHVQLASDRSSNTSSEASVGIKTQAIGCYQATLRILRVNGWEGTMSRDFRRRGPPGNGAPVASVSACFFSFLLPPPPREISQQLQFNTWVSGSRKVANIFTGLFSLSLFLLLLLPRYPRSWTWTGGASGGGGPCGALGMLPSQAGSSGGLQGWRLRLRIFRDFPWLALRVAPDVDKVGT